MMLKPSILSNIALFSELIDVVHKERKVSSQFPFSLFWLILPLSCIVKIIVMMHLIAVHCLLILLGRLHHVIVNLLCGAIDQGQDHYLGVGGVAPAAKILSLI